ncbi:response regulator [bacterium]|nr:response regulator [bacterium]
MSLKKVLIVEDSPEDQFLGKIVFRKFDQEIEVMCVFDGMEAIEALQVKNFDPDVILLDINMPRMSGLEFLQKYSPELNPDMPPVVVMLTSSEQESDKSTTMTYPAVKDYLIKPIVKENIPALIELVNSLES